MKALSIKQPWAHLIASGIKDIENRTWRTNFRGRIYIHASGTPAKEPYKIFTDEQASLFIDSDLDFKMLGSYKQTSQIIGQVDVIDCVINHPSIWAEKMITHKCKETGIQILQRNQKYIWNWVLANPVLYDKPILNVKGKLSFWEFRDLVECRCCKNKETDEEMNICERCEQEFCSDCQAPYNQFSQVDYNCCSTCYERNDDR